MRIDSVGVLLIAGFLVSCAQLNGRTMTDSKEIKEQKFTDENSQIVQKSQESITVRRVFAAKPRSVTFQFNVKLQCEQGRLNNFALPVKGTLFRWKLGEAAHGEAMTDNQGQAQFSYTSFDGRHLNETLEIEYKEHTYRFASAEGVALIVSEKGCAP